MQYSADQSIIPFSNPGYPNFQCPLRSNSNLYYHKSTYRCGRTDSPASRLKNERLRCERNLGWSIDFATAFIVNHLDPDTSPNAAHLLKSIRKKAQQVFAQGRGQEVPYLAFSKLDNVLFAGHLGGAVYLDIRSLGHDASGATYTHGRHPNPRVQRISIVLNDDVLQQAEPRDVVANLIHHMIHAFFLVACGPEEEKEADYGRLSHGMHFGKVASTIKRLSAKQGKPLPLGFGRYLHSTPYSDDYLPRRQPRRSSKWYRSNCHPSIPPIRESDIEDFYSTACAPLLDLPSSVQKAQVHTYNSRRHCLEEVSRASSLATPSADSVELLFDDNPVQVPREKIENYLCVAKAFDRAKSRYLAVPEDVSKDTLLTLLELLHTDSYSPDIRAVTTPGKIGPPRIMSFQADSPPYLVTDIALFKAADAMRFTDVKSIALERLRAQTSTHEDPVLVLKTLYEGGEPDPELRDWARKFLAKGRESSSYDSWPGYGRRGVEVCEPPNLVKLKRDYMLSERFFGLVGRFGALESDVRQVEEWLARESCARYGAEPMGMYGGFGGRVSVSPNGFAHPYGLPPVLGIGGQVMEEWSEGYVGGRPCRIGFGDRYDGGEWC